MPGMNSGLNPADPTIVNAFRSALLHQWLIAAAIFVLLLLVWGATRTWVTVQATGGAAAGPDGAATAAGAHPQDAGATAQAPAALAAPQPVKAAPAEPRARRLLRIGFGLLWIFDGILQAQPKMAAGHAVAGHRAHRGELARLGAARRERGRDHLDLPPGRGAVPRWCGSRSGSACG